jgi:hypothetical protein
LALVLVFNDLRLDCASPINHGKLSMNRWARPLRQDISVGYVYCSGWKATPFTQFYEKFKTDPRVQTAVIDTGRHCMLTEPLKTIEVLANLA